MLEQGAPTDLMEWFVGSFYARRYEGNYLWLYAPIEKLAFMIRCH
jgi:hypothetical protein